MAVLYVDESGEEGFGDSSTEWLILGGALQRGSDKAVVIETYNEFRARTNRQDNWFFHFHKKSHEERLAFISDISGSAYCGMAVCIHKPSIRFRENFKRPYFLYFYALRFLLERATRWTAQQPQETPLTLMLSSRRGLKEQNLVDYFSTLRASPHTKLDAILWDKLNHNSVHIEPNEKYIGLQVSDCVASSLGKALEFSREFNTVEPRYIQDLSPIFSKHPQSVRSSVKIWPEPPTAMRKHPRLGWYYGRGE